MKIGFFGGDERMAYLAEKTADAGYTVGAASLRCRVSEEEIGALCRTCAVLVFPLPASRDGERVSGTDTRFSALSLPPALRVWGGAFPPGWKKDGVPLYDCFSEEPLQQKNAALTAQGAIRAALGATGRGFYGLSAAVIGYGRIGQYLARYLAGFGVPVTVYARREEVRAAAVLCGYRAKPLLREMHLPEPLVFGTVPAPVYSAVTADADAFCIDLGGGMPPKLGDAAVESARGVPGRFAPKGAAEILFESLSVFLREAEGLPSLSP